MAADSNVDGTFYLSVLFGLVLLLVGNKIYRQAAQPEPAIGERRDIALLSLKLGKVADSFGRRNAPVH